MLAARGGAGALGFTRLGQPDPARAGFPEERHGPLELDEASRLEEAERPHERGREGAPAGRRGVEAAEAPDTTLEGVDRFAPARREGGERLAPEAGQADPSSDHGPIVATGSDSPEPALQLAPSFDCTRASAALSEATSAARASTWLLRAPRAS